MAKYPIISADSHVNEPIDLWKSRLPDQYKERAPHKEVIDGVEYSIIEGLRPRKMASGRERLSDEQVSQARAGGWDPEFRMKDQDRDGVNAEVIYPSGALNVFASPDPQFQLAMARVYNDWTSEVFGPYSDRFVPAAIIPVQDIPAAVEEVGRAAKMGFRALFLPTHPGEVLYNYPDYDPLWSAIQEVGLPANFHVSTGREPRGERGPGGAVINYLLFSQADGMLVMSPLTSAGVLQRFPNLQVVTVESGAGWMAWAMHVLDEAYVKHQSWVRPKLDMLPSEYWKRQGHTTFQDDPTGIANRHLTGIDCLLWGNDYPHPEGTWPKSQEAIENEFAGVPDDERRAIIFENSAKLYGFSKLIDDAKKMAAATA